ncbi:MAG: mechanosensitive ion channel MscS, small conductance mechanosensitive channel [Candidatus Saccharibacteria bacterium]|nr:mechanosensitive ion channel MscS, small conductance mechanosensitive channel [Candidatus Saccharibacteria bacterium]
MTQNNFIDTVNHQISDFFSQPNDYRAVLILVFSILFAYWLSRFLAQGIVYIAQKVAVRSDSETREDRIVLYRQVETYLSIAVASVRVIVVAVVAYITWRILTPVGSSNAGGSGAAAIGASAFFIVVAGATIGILLRDITSGATMIIEKWFTIGDFIKVEPFIDMQGVVERMTLRSTKLRSLSGEVIWIHNQQIQAVHVTPRGVRTIAVDIFVRSIEAGEAAVQQVVNAMPTGATMVARPLKMTKPEQWGHGVWRITVIGEMTPGREWLMEQYFVSAIKKIDEDAKKADKLLALEPIARYADPVADKRFKRAIRVAQTK